MKKLLLAASIVALGAPAVADDAGAYLGGSAESFSGVSSGSAVTGIAQFGWSGSTSIDTFAGAENVSGASGSLSAGYGVEQGGYIGVVPVVVENPGGNTPPPFQGYQGVIGAGVDVEGDFDIDLGTYSVGGTVTDITTSDTGFGTYGDGGAFAAQDGFGYADGGAWGSTD